MRSITCVLIVVAGLNLLGCQKTKPEYGVERPLFLPGATRQTWAVAPVINLSGQKQVDPILQADLLHRQLGLVAGVNPLPVNRVVEVYAALRIDRVQSEEQAALVCDLLNCDALVVAAVTDFDPFDPPKMGAAMQLFRKGDYRRPANVDPYVLARRATPLPGQMPTSRPGFAQVVGMFDSANGSIRADLMRYAQGRTDPDGPYRERAYLVEMDRYCGFVYHSLLEQLLAKPALN
jgi:hypothetical protein